MRYSRNPEQTHKVAFTGAGCVGKTALLKSVKKHYGGSSMGFIDEAARVYFTVRPGIPEDERYSFEHQEVIQSMVMGLERIANDQELGCIFTDRSVFDAPVCVASTGDTAGAEELFERAQMWLPGKSKIAYSQIYVLDPADVPYKVDAIRKESEATRQRQHEMFLEFFDSHNITHKLLGGSLEERTETVLATLPNTSVK